MTSVFTFPAGRTAVLRTFTLSEYDNGAVTGVRLYVTPSTGGTYTIYNFGAVAALGTAAYTYWTALNPGDGLSVYCTGSRMIAAGFGALLLGAPE